MSALAEITSGAKAGSTQVKVTRTAANGTGIFVYRGALLLGSASLVAGVALVNLATPLATGDVIQASVTSKGNQCGNPVTVVANPIKVTGWKSATEVNVVQENGQQLTMPVSQFVQMYGYQPASVFDSIGTNAVLQPEYVPAEVCPIAFDLNTEKQAGQTVLTVTNVQNTKGGTLISWNEGPYSNTIAQTYTEATAVTIDVKGADDTTPLRRSIAVAILEATPENGSITGLSWKSDSIRRGFNAIAHCQNQLQFRLEGFDFAWRDAIFYPPTQNEQIYHPVPNGSYTLWAREKGDSAEANWMSLTFTLNT
ncbi:hypothetical protein [Tellurirhabdus bombi]|uniref:hypothetical protein n=1 Tax=Tellurirhabdus bombi TaxID=2907205 RepID=UPI001F22FE35|nr:hypothetical protein [Tellurirhabdus bombi]